MSFKDANDSHKRMWEKSIPGRRNSKGNSPEVVAYFTEHCAQSRVGKGESGPSAESR